MIERDKIEEITRSLLKEAQVDAVGLWVVLSAVEDDAEPSISPEDAKEATLVVVRELLADGRLVAGDFVDQDDDTAIFVRWSLSANDALERIEREWAALGRELLPGDVVWFVDLSLLPVVLFKHPMVKNWKPPPRRS